MSAETLAHRRGTKTNLVCHTAHLSGALNGLIKAEPGRVCVQPSCEDGADDPSGVWSQVSCTLINVQEKINLLTFVLTQTLPVQSGSGLDLDGVFFWAQGGSASDPQTWI